VYTDIETSRGTKSPADYGSGVEYADGMFDLFPDQSLGLQVRSAFFGTQAKSLLYNTDRQYEWLTNHPSCVSVSFSANRLDFGSLELKVVGKSLTAS
jgi:hypothetical protein